MPRIDEEIEIARPVEEVFAVVSDVERAPEWLSALREVRELSTRPIALGATFVEVASFMGKRLETPKVVVEMDPPHRFVHRSTGGEVPQEVAMRLEAIPGGTRLHLGFEAEPGGFFGALPVTVLVTAMRVIIGDNLAVLKERLERG